MAPGSWLMLRGSLLKAHGSWPIKELPRGPPGSGPSRQFFTENGNNKLIGINLLECTWWELWWVPGASWVSNKTDRGSDVRLPYANQYFHIHGYPRISWDFRIDSCMSGSAQTICTTHMVPSTIRMGSYTRDLY